MLTAVIGAFDVGLGALAVTGGLMAGLWGLSRVRTTRGLVGAGALGLVLLGAAVQADDPPDDGSRRGRVGWSIAAGLGACVVGLFWGRWLEGGTALRREDEDDSES